MNQRHADTLLDAAVKCHRDIIRRRTREALQDKIRRGERCGKVRYGYDLGPDGKTLVPNASEQKVIRLIQELRADGYSLREIAFELTEQLKVPTKEGRPWKHTSVQGILDRVTF